jgi:hypothetical protein
MERAMGVNRIVFVSDSWGKRRWNNYNFNYCEAVRESHLTRSRSGVFYDKYQYFMNGYNVLVQNDMQESQHLLFRIQFSNKKELSSFFRWFSRFYEAKVKPIEEHNSQIDSPKEMRHISIEDIIWSLTQSAIHLNYSPRKTKNLFKSVAEFI